MRKGFGFHDRHSPFRFNPATLFTGGQQGAWYDPGDIKQLLALANKSKGSFMAGMMLASIFGAWVTWTINFFR